MKTLQIYDTTLRDGTQGGGINLSCEDKLRIARKLDAFGVHYIEGGWPGSNPKDVEFFERAATMKWDNARIAAFGSTRRAGVAVEQDPQILTLQAAGTPVVTFYGKSWALHVTEILRTTHAENQAMIRDTSAYFKKHGKEVIYDAEHFFDGYKDDPEYALSTLRAAAEGGADMLVLCDTNGGTLPHEVSEITRQVIQALALPIGIHTHDDAGMGAANALAAILSGASHIQGTINGFGERTGNCNMTTVLPNLQLKMGYHCVPDMSRLSDLSRFVDDMANYAHNPKAPFVGEHAFSHKGGTHVNAVQKLARSYEHIEPQAVGNQQFILVSELSGQSNVLLKAEELGIALEKGSPKVKEILQLVKNRENEGYEFEAADASFELLIRREVESVPTFFQLLEYHTTHRHGASVGLQTCEATVKLMVGDERIYTVEEGDGPVNALDSALRKALLPFYPEVVNVTLTDFKVRIIDSHSGTAAKTRVLINSSNGSQSWGTVGVSGNIIDASWEALVESLEYYLLRYRG